MSKTQYFPYTYFEGKIVKTDEAKISIMSNSLQYGNAIFAGIRAYISHNKKQLNIFRIDDHYQRFLKSLNIIGKSVSYSKKDLIEVTIDLARKNEPKTDCYIRPIAYTNSYEISPDLSKLEFDLAIYMLPLGEYLPVSKGLKLMFSSWLRINDNMIPARAKICGGYINSSLAKAEASRLSYDDALMMSSDGHVAEGSAANFFIVRDGTLITSSKYCDTLEGITRRSIIRLAKDINIAVEEREIDRTEVYVSDEAFLCGTGVQVAWIAEVDGRKIGSGKIGPITKKLQRLFFDIVRGKEKRYSNWLTKV